MNTTVHRRVTVTVEAMTTPMDELADRRAPITSADASPAELLSVVDAARWLGVSRSNLYRALSAHRIPVTPVNLGGHLRLPRRQLERWLEGDLASDTRPSGAPASAPPRRPRGGASYDDVFRLLARVDDRTSTKVGQPSPGADARRERMAGEQSGVTGGRALPRPAF